MSEKDEPQVRVVDRRWWAQPASGETDERGESGGRKPTYIEQLERRLADATAEFEQAKVRIRRDVGREVERGRRAVLAELLDVVDNLDRAIAAADDRSSPLLRGVELVREQFLAKLEMFGVMRVDAAGRPFDANLHEAISTEPVADPSQEGVVVRVVREGYAIGDELLRPASVIVGTRG